MSPITIDTICLSLFALSGIIGIFRGFTKELLSLFTWFLSIGITYIFHDQFLHLALGYIKNPFIAKSIVSFVMFISLYIILNIIVYFIVSLIKDSILSGLDRTLGFFYGFLRGYIILVLVHQFVCLFFSSQVFPDVLKKSFFYEYVESGSLYLNQALPDQVKSYFDRNEQSLQNIGSKSSFETNSRVASSLKETQNNVQQLLKNMNTNSAEVEKFAKLKPRIDSSQMDAIAGTSKEQQKSLGRFFASQGLDLPDSDESVKKETINSPEKLPQHDDELNDVLGKLF